MCCIYCNKTSGTEMMKRNAASKRLHRAEDANQIFVSEKGRGIDVGRVKETFVLHRRCYPDSVASRYQFSIHSCNGYVRNSPA